MPTSGVKVTRNFYVSGQCRMASTILGKRKNASCKILKQKNGGHLKRGGTLQCPPVRSGRPRTLRTVTGWWEEHPTRGCQSRLHPLVETIHFSDYSSDFIQVKKNILFPRNA